MRWCQRCVLPDTRPNLVIGADGVCNACKNHGTKKVIDWEARERLWQQVVANAKHRSTGYDCLIPVSGGKDSTWQVVKCLEYGLNPLAFTWKTPARTALGRRNLENLVSLGVDHMDYQVNPKVEKRFLRESLARYGSTAIPMHMAIFNMPLTLAVRYAIPLIVWGENSAFEYGGSEEESTGFKLDRAWMQKFGVTHGTTAQDWVQFGFDRKAMLPYFGPAPEELAARDVLAVFLGYYFPWDVEISLKTACEHGFQVRVDGPKTGYYNYADIDDDFISIHHFLKWYKFGFTRLFDNLSLEIRHGRMTRERAIDIIKQQGAEPPHDDIALFCAFVGMTQDQFFQVIEPFRNLAIWHVDQGVWKIRDFLMEDWNWK
ncbi:MAG: N-acetyl sugar amidotransferase [Magnetococcales bacterium]|nr:N-acetyl sugar amidotransferase [Magnetococcales bacterium]MBF0321485.1 N-acetyl sugar amidotransferase [Magnetococcales bacterium]